MEKTIKQIVQEYTAILSVCFDKDNKEKKPTDPKAGFFILTCGLNEENRNEVQIVTNLTAGNLIKILEGSIEQIQKEDEAID